MKTEQPGNYYLQVKLYHIVLPHHRIQKPVNCNTDGALIVSSRLIISNNLIV